MSHPRSPDSIPELDRDWNAFISLDQMTNHWSRASWWPGRRAFYWYLTFDCNSELRSLTEQCQSAIEAPHFDLVPPGDLHMTIARIGFEDELREDELDAVVTAASRAGQRISSFDMLIGPLAGSSGAISFSVAPLEPIQRVREVLLATSAEGRKNSKSTNNYFRPHVGIAYCNTTIPTSRIVPKIQPLRELPPSASARCRRQSGAPNPRRTIISMVNNRRMCVFRSHSTPVLLLPVTGDRGFDEDFCLNQRIAAALVGPIASRFW